MRRKKLKVGFESKRVRHIIKAKARESRRLALKGLI